MKNKLKNFLKKAVTFGLAAFTVVGTAGTAVSPVKQTTVHAEGASRGDAVVAAFNEVKSEGTYGYGSTTKWNSIAKQTGSQRTGEGTDCTRTTAYIVSHFLQKMGYSGLSDPDWDVANQYSTTWGPGLQGVAKANGIKVTDLGTDFTNAQPGDVLVFDGYHVSVYGGGDITYDAQSGRISGATNGVHENHGSTTYAGSGPGDGSTLQEALNDYNRRKSSASEYITSIASTDEDKQSDDDNKKEAMASAILFSYAYIESDDDNHNNARYVTGITKDWDKFINCISDDDFTPDDYDADKNKTWDNLVKAGFKDVRKYDDKADDLPDIIVLYAQELAEGSMKKVEFESRMSQLYGEYTSDQAQWPIDPKDQTGSYTSFNDMSWGIAGSRHYGYDLGLKRGTPIYAAIDGIFCPPGQYMGLSAMGSGNEMDVWTNIVGDKYKVNYNHLSGFAPGIRPGSRVKKGQLIGYSGTANGVDHLCMRFCDANWNSGNRSDGSHFYTFSDMHLKEPMPLCNQHRGC